ncbi:MAG: FapA family protein [Desulfovibrio sp.]|uniref:FapA family protein n=1 Tax=Desulfovibrio sp. 7SRBS1 TaxID=3378064 RepID=UPI003B3EF492
MADNETNLPASTPEAQAPAVVDAHVRFCGSKDGIKVGISRYTPETDGGAPLCLKSLERMLRESGVRAPLIKDNALEAIERLQAGKSVKTLVIAQGKKPVNARDARITPNGNWDFPAFPGQVIGTLVASRAPEIGMGIDGEPISPNRPDPPREIETSEDVGCYVNPETNEVHALFYGLPVLKANKLAVQMLLGTSPGKVEVIGTLYPKDFLDEPITTERIEEMLKGMKVAIKPLHEEIQKALKKAAKSGRPVENVVLVRGIRPVHGQDGKLEMLIAQRSLTGTKVKGGRIDYRDRGFSPSATDGTDIARLHPPTKGKPGLDVHGAPIPARNGTPLRVTPGRGVEAIKEKLPQSEEGQEEFQEPVIRFRARMDGLVLRENDVISISELLEVNGDVDFNTGNIRVPRGSVRIAGTVRTSFMVSAPENVLVEGVVENALIKAGGSVEVGGGLLMKKGGGVAARGNVMAQFANNARIVAGGEVIMASNITASLVRAGGKVVLSEDRGKIRGGTIVSGEGIEAYEIGTPMGVNTVLAISREDKQTRPLIKEKRELAARLKKLDIALGEEEDSRKILRKTPPDRRQAVEKLIALRDLTRTRHRQVGRTLAELAEKALLELHRIKIRVPGTIHPGTRIKAAGQSLPVVSPIYNSQIFWDPEQKKIVVLGL